VQDLPLSNFSHNLNMEDNCLRSRLLYPNGYRNKDIGPTLDQLLCFDLEFWLSTECNAAKSTVRESLKDQLIG